MEKKILFIATEIFGTRAGSFRQERWVKAFLNAGYKCYIFDNLSLFGNFEVFDNLEDFILFRQEIRRTVKSAPSIKEGFIINILRKLKHFFLWEALNPLNFLHLIIILCKLKLRPVNFIFSSSPPFSSAVIGFYYKLLYSKTQFILDFRDEWANHPFLPKQTIIDRKIVERIVIKKVDNILTVSDFIRLNIENKHECKVNLVYNAPDIFFTNNSIKKEIDVFNINIAYTGSLPNSSFDLNTLYLILKKSDEVFGRKVKFNFVGACSNLQKLNCPPNTSFVEHKTLLEVRELQTQADILLFLGANFLKNGGIVSAKIFEYLQSEKPILPLFIQENSDIYYIIKSSCGFCPIISSENEFIDIIRKIIIEKRLESIPKLNNEDFVSQLLSQYTSYTENLIKMNEK